jgi:O-antigen ligase
MRQDGESDAKQDKSLMIRLMMIEKTKEIFNLHPVFGIGPNMFKYYNAPLNFRNKYNRLDYRDDKYINTRSSHGTYFQIISEFGIIGLLFFLILILSPLLSFLKKLIKNKNEKSDLFLVGLLGVALHFISVSALTGTISWFIIGVAWSIQKNRQLQ